MHESAIAYDLYATARRAAIEHDATRVIRLCVECGALAMVNPEQVRFLFAVMVEDDPLFKETVLDVVTVEPVMTCSCGRYEGDDPFICQTLNYIRQLSDLPKIPHVCVVR